MAERPTHHHWAFGGAGHRDEANGQAQRNADRTGKSEHVHDHRMDDLCTDWCHLVHPAGTEVTGA